MIVKTSYDHEGCHAVIVSADGETLARGYEFVTTAGSWPKCRDAAIEIAKAKHAALEEFGPAPEPEQFSLGGGLHVA